MAQQTAVSFLLRELRIEDLAKGEQLSVVLQICEQAKKMEKEQTKHAFIIGGQQGFLSASEEEYMNFEQYYNEIYLK